MAQGTQPVTPLLENILHQPEALLGVAQYHANEGLRALEYAAELLLKRKRIVVTGMGASYHASLGFTYALTSSGFQAQCVEASELLYFLGSEVDAETVLILVSRSGESVEITRLLANVRATGAATVAISNVPESTLAKAADCCILMASPADEFVAIQTYTATVSTFALLHATLENVLIRASAELQNTAKILAQWIPECVAARHHLDEFLNMPGPCYILARGPALGSVAEAVLLMHETAKTAAIGMSTPQFRHGPVEAVDADFHTIVLGTQRQTVNLDAALANDITSMKGTVRWLGPPVSTCHAVSLCRWPDEVPSRFYAVAEIVPLQCLAYRNAELRGIPPGKFRWAPQVTASESGFAITQSPR